MIIKSSFNPPWFLHNPHLQTILANVLHPSPPQVSHEIVELADGDQLRIARGTSQGPDTVLVLHGLEGSLKSAYAQRLMNYLNTNQIPAVFMYFRGCDGKPNRLIRSYHSGETGDLRSVIHYLKKTGSERIALVGYSLGGNVTLKYMGEHSTDPTVVCACAVSVPLLLDVCANRMNRGFSKLYQHTLLQRLKHKVIQKEQQLVEAGYSTELKSIRNFIQFDDRFTAPTHGFEDAMHYYRSCSSRQFLKHIDKPTLIIHAKDDPFMTTEVIPETVELSPSTTLELAEYGGHVGFISGTLFKPKYWLEPRVMTFLIEHFIPR